MELDNLENEIKQSRYLVLGATALITFIYFIWFFFVEGRGISTDPTNWGAFGDFVGGLINPLIAFFAFYWLTKSVIIQKTELAATRDALEETQRAQEDQVQIALQTAKIQSLNIILNSINHKISIERDYMSYIISEYQKIGDQYNIMTREGTSEKIAVVMPMIQRNIDILLRKQDELILEVEQLNTNA